MALSGEETARELAQTLLPLLVLVVLLVLLLPLALVLLPLEARFRVDLAEGQMQRQRQVQVPLLHQLRPQLLPSGLGWRRAMQTLALALAVMLLQV